MYYNLPTVLYCEKDCITNHAADICSYGKTAYIITGKHSSKKNGSLDDITHALKDGHVSYKIYDNISENPSIENIMDAVGDAPKGCDFVIGIGGGSPLDAAKAVSLMLANPDKGSDFLYEKISCKANYLPVVTVPTTCGTGSEVTPYSILTIHGLRTKSSLPHRIYPSLALIDPMYLDSAPDNVLKNTAVDALGHLIESYINANATNISKMFVNHGLSMFRAVPYILKNNIRNYESYELLMMIAAYAGMAISHTGTSLPHKMSYPVTYEQGVPHGKAVGAFLAAYMKHADIHECNHILSQCGLPSIQALSEVVRSLCGEITVPASLAESAVKDMLSDPKKLKNCPYPVNEDILHDIYKDSVHII